MDFTAALRARTFLFLIGVAPAGLAMKYYAGPGRWWVNNWGASFAYEAFFVGLIFFLVAAPTRLPGIAAGVCAVTIVLEFLQLWKPPWLEALRSTFVGRSLLGNAFSWRDLPAYPLGCVLGWFLISRWIVATSRRARET